MTRNNLEEEKQCENVKMVNQLQLIPQELGLELYSGLREKMGMESLSYKGMALKKIIQYLN
ncbi:hypothetical protein BH18THE1_BH18THE1_00140 [soil metagenome]